MIKQDSLIHTHCHMHERDEWFCIFNRTHSGSVTRTRICTRTSTHHSSAVSSLCRKRNTVVNSTVYEQQRRASTAQRSAAHVCKSRATALNNIPAGGDDIFFLLEK